MNKAFVREPEENRDRCPSCGSAGIAVFEITLKVWLSEEQRRQLSDSAFFCPHATCPVAYFDRFERTVPAAGIAVPFWPKSTGSPICPCFGLTLADIEADVADGAVTRVRATIQRAGSDEAQCRTKSPSGESCVAAVQKCYMQLRDQ